MEADGEDGSTFRALGRGFPTAGMEDTRKLMDSTKAEISAAMSVSQQSTSQTRPDFDWDKYVRSKISAMSRQSTYETRPDFDWDKIDRRLQIDKRLETWNDPTPRESLFTLEELHEACVDAAKRQFSRRTRSPTREERLTYRDEHDRSSLMIALQAYAKKTNMQSTDLEFVEVKQRNLIDECGKGFLHFNFVVKERGGELANFFAEVHPDLKDEKDVYLCIPLDEKDFNLSEDDDQAHCYGCKYRAKDRVHPSSGGFLGGHRILGFPFMEFSSDDESSSADD